MAFLCHIIPSKGVEVDLKKIEAIRNWPRPLSPINIRSFLSLASNNRRFLDGFASIAYPLTTFTLKNVIFEYLEACESNYHILKDRLTTVPILTLQEDTKGFVVHCDASQVGWGCVLM